MVHLVLLSTSNKSLHSNQPMNDRVPSDSKAGRGKLSRLFLSLFVNKILITLIRIVVRQRVIS